MSRLWNRRSSRTERGFSLIELMIAMLILAIGLIGGLAVILTGIATNASNRFDTTAVALAQSVMDRIIVVSTSATTQSTSMTDCLGHSFTINTTPGTTAAGAGAPLSTGLPDLNTSIDFSKAAVTGYQLYNSAYNPALFAVCANGVTGNVTQYYDVRWNISAPINTSGSAVLVHVAAKNVAEANNGQTQARFFAMPITLRAIRGN